MLLAGGRRVGDRLCQRGGFDVANRVVRRWLQRLLVSQLAKAPAGNSLASSQVAG
jgi:hypothetical protein